MHWIAYLFVLLISISCSHGNWMYLGLTPDPIDNKTENCEAKGLVSKQLRLCEQNPVVLSFVRQGIKQAIQQCQNQFLYERWNCTTYQNNDIFGLILTQGTRESAFIYSILAAGVTDAITRACTIGALKNCSCMKISSKSKSFTPGCSENIRYGMAFVRKFVNAPLRRNVHGNRINAHNALSGRKVVKQLMELRCECHGRNKTCDHKTCWKVLPSFHKVGQKLKEMYHSAIRVSKKGIRKHKNPKHVRLNWKNVTKKDMIYLNSSPDYCRSDPENGILGTEGRSCVRNAINIRGCELLCCGRGYKTKIIRRKGDCTTCKTEYSSTCK